MSRVHAPRRARAWSSRCFLCLLCALCVSTGLAQPFRCDWNVVGIGGGEMSSTAYRCGATAGQTAVGQMSSAQFLAMIGFWQTDVPVGIQEAAKWPSGPALQTRLYAPRPNPCRGSAALRYTLDAQRQVLLQVHDLAGRVVRTLCASSMKRGAYSVTWDGTDDVGRRLASGAYFLKFAAGAFRQTEKLVLQK